MWYSGVGGEGEKPNDFKIYEQIYKQKFNSFNLNTFSLYLCSRLNQLPNKKVIILILINGIGSMLENIIVVKNGAYKPFQLFSRLLASCSKKQYKGSKYWGAWQVTKDRREGGTGWKETSKTKILFFCPSQFYRLVNPKMTRDLGLTSLWFSVKMFMLLSLTHG